MAGCGFRGYYQYDEKRKSLHPPSIFIFVGLWDAMLYLNRSWFTTPATSAAPILSEAPQLFTYANQQAPKLLVTSILSIYTPPAEPAD